jgi:Zn-dependent M28 family amino/carboxypeptidase
MRFTMALQGSIEHQLKQHIDTLAGEIGERNIFHPPALAAAEHYIQQQWQQQGYAVNVQRYEVKGVDCANLEVSRTGSLADAPAIVIGAHYDSVQGGPGANDNGSGVAAMLVLSRLFTKILPKATVRFVAFVNEEPPFFYWSKMGSMVYAKRARQRGDRIRFMVSLETIGYYPSFPRSQAYPPLLKWFYPDRGDFIAFVSNFRSRRSMLQAASQFRQCTDFPLQHLATFPWLPGVCWSDHLSFWRQGYHAFMITDTAFYRYPYYHLPSDTPDKIHYAPMAQVTEALFCTMAALAQQP